MHQRALRAPGGQEEAAQRFFHFLLARHVARHAVQKLALLGVHAASVTKERRV
jgi:hypothetical protein